MVNRQRGSTFRLVIALAMTMTLLLSPFGHAALHDMTVPGAATETLQEASAAAVSRHNHGHSHSHDEAWLQEGHTTASHGHHAADHLHEVPAPADFPALALTWSGDTPSAFPANFPPQGPLFPIERPPQS